MFGLESVVEAYADPVAVGEQGRTCDAEAEVGAAGSIGRCGAAGQHSGSGGVVKLVLHSDSGEVCLVESQGQNIQIEVDVAVGRKLPAEAGDDGCTE